MDIVAAERKPVTIRFPERARIYWPAIFIVLFLAAGGLVSIPAIFRSVGDAGQDSILAGEWSRSFETKFSSSMPLQEVSSSVWGAIRYTVFDEGKNGVLIGKDAWLFTTEEYDIPPEYRENTTRNVYTVASVKRRLAEKGIRLMVALIPAKARVYAERSPQPLPPAARGRYADFRERLLREGVAAPDLLEPLQTAALKQPVFLETDTHWTPFGAGIVADAVALDIESTFLSLKLQKTSFSLTLEDAIAVRGDLLPFLSLGIFDGIGPGEVAVQPYFAEMTGSSSLGLFDDPVIPVAVVGTSYSADPRWSFVEALKISLQSDVLSVATAGEGPFIPMLEYLESETIGEFPPRLVIWEIPERYVTNRWDLTPPS